MISENPVSPYLPASRSLATDCGVDTTMSHSSTIPARVSGFMLPFISPTLVSTSMRENDSRCWSTRGLVGARTRTLPDDRYSAATLTATTVLPRPVGSITRVLFLRHPCTIAVWYLRSSTESGTMRGCVMNVMGRPYYSNLKKKVGRGHLP